MSAPAISERGYALLSDYGNAALAPERSRSFDAGIELGDRNVYGLHFALTAFRRDTRGLIDYVSCFGASTGICATASNARGSSFTSDSTPSHAVQRPPANR